MGYKIKIYFGFYLRFILERINQSILTTKVGYHYVE